MNPNKVKMTPLEMQQTTEEIMRELGSNIHTALKQYFPNSGFALIIFSFNEPGICNYISNAGRDSMITALKETVKKFETNEDIPTGSKTVH